MASMGVDPDGCGSLPCHRQGTTGGDRELLMSTTKAAGTTAVIAPNMAKQIVALQVGGGVEEEEDGCECLFRSFRWVLVGWS